jgi:soluble lytic murein transglycosylase-like protein
MRPFIGFLILSAAFIFVGEARAQQIDIPETDLASDAETQPSRTPMMVVHEPAVLPQPDKAKPAAGATGKISSKKLGDKASATASAAQPGTTTQQPIVIPAASVVQSELASTGNSKYDQFVLESAARNGVDPNLIVAVMRQESGFNFRARSYKGATGLMQLMPATAARFGVVNIYDPQQNIEGGARYLRFLLDTFDGDVNLVLAGYNAGENAVVNSGYRIPRYRETQNYVRSISARYNSSGNARSKPVIKNPTAPAAATFSAGASSRLSNNY